MKVKISVFIAYHFLMISCSFILARMGLQNKKLEITENE